MSLFKRLFGLGKTDNEDTNIDYGVKDLKKGYILDYDLTNWEVQDVAVYTWDNGAKDFEYTISNGKERLYLNYCSDDASVSIYRDAKVKNVLPNVRTEIKYHGEPESPFSYAGRVYNNAGSGAAKVKSLTETYEMENWLFEDEDEELLISVNKYQDGSVDLYTGKHLDQFAVSNILPRG
jgi:hypothetical protein